MLLFVPPVAVGGKQRHSRRLHPAAPHLQLHQRAGLWLPPAQPEEWPAAEALRRPQVRREEDRGGGLRPLHPRAGQGGRDCRGQVERGGCCALPRLEGKTQGSTWGSSSWGQRVQVCARVWVCVCANACMRGALDGWQRARRGGTETLAEFDTLVQNRRFSLWKSVFSASSYSSLLFHWVGFATVPSNLQQSTCCYYKITLYWCLIGEVGRRSLRVECSSRTQLLFFLAVCVYLQKKKWNVFTRYTWLYFLRLNVLLHPNRSRSLIYKGNGWRKMIEQPNTFYSILTRWEKKSLCLDFDHYPLTCIYLVFIFYKWGFRSGRAKEMEKKMHFTWYKATLQFLFFM